MRRLIEYIKGNIFWRNVVLAGCAIVVFLFLCNIVLNLYTRHGQKHSVPNFIGMNLEEAEQAAKEFSLELEIIDSLFIPSQKKGAVLEQYPKGGNNVKSGRRIFLTVNSFTPKITDIPYVTGFSLRQAKNKLVTSGFVIERLIYKSDIATNNVIEQRYNNKLIRPNSDTQGEIGSGIVLIVGANATDPAPIVPKLIGLSIDQAKNKLWEAGFNVGEVVLDKDITFENINEAKVYEQSPNQVTRSHYGNEVSFRATIDTKKINTGSSASDKAAKKYLEQWRNRADTMAIDSL